MNRIATRPVLLNLLTVAVTVVVVSLVLVAGRGGVEPIVELVVGQPSPQEFVATSFVEITDKAETDAQRVLARINTKSVFARSAIVESAQQVSVDALFDEIETVAPDIVFPPDVTTTTTEPPAEEATTTATTVVEEGSTTSTSITTTTTIAPTTTTTTEPPPDVVEQTEVVAAKFRTFEDAITILVRLHNADIERTIVGESQGFLIRVKGAVDRSLDQAFQAEIRSQLDLTDARNEILEDPPVLFITGQTDEERRDTSFAIARIVEGSLVVNFFVDDDATAAAEQEAIDAVEETVIQFFPGVPIVGLSEPITEVQLEAINMLRLNVVEVGADRVAVALLGAIAVVLAAFFLWRLAPTQWSKPKHFALLGILLVLAAAASRVPGVVTGDEIALGFLLPAMMFGYMAAILYDPRTAVLMALPMATFTAVSTGDVALTLYAAVATVVPVAFVSAASSRRDLRLAIALATVVLSPIGFATSWLFYGIEHRWQGALFAFLGGVGAGLVAQGLVSFFETLFRVTTTLTLLDLTDRNHPALRLIEEKAPGTFNHSILVGTLAGRAAREIGANALLAQAAAYYHDLGKTENPRFFIENQFGVSNPHDRLDPVASAAIIRRHVSDGLRLAREYRLPDEIVDAIRMHHGSGLMRYFYHEAIAADENVDPALFRHEGVKPRRKELAILMICDAIEGASRAAATQQDPTEDSLTALVDTIVGEKLDDGQLEESDLTFGELTRVKRAIVEALVGYYHTRVPYPGFPGNPAEST
ncbi:MAG: HDIG domain-containing protein [Acidobacteria bacterium]|nr:HDIG domain-containing protein [Acidobacteriota bacterium]